MPGGDLMDVLVAEARVIKRRIAQGAWRRACFAPKVRPGRPALHLDSLDMRADGPSERRWSCAAFLPMRLMEAHTCGCHMCAGPFFCYVLEGICR